MKKVLSLLLCGLMMAGCSNTTITQVTAETAPTRPTLPEATAAPEYISRFDAVTEIHLSDEGIRVDGGAETETVYTSCDIIYYEDRDTYASGNPYGEGTGADRHSEEEAAAHTVVNITEPGAYRITGSLSAGQIRIDLGEAAYDDPRAVAELILCDAQISCTVAPAILFLNTYECDGGWSAEEPKVEVDTSAAGANLILEGENKVKGAYVARIYKDQQEEKKLWKQDGAIYSYQSMNVFGPGSLELTAANEGLDTELHLTINGGTIQIQADNDGINTNEDGVSVTTINGGDVTIFAGLGAEGDGIDSNGYLVINGGTVLASAHPAADAGLDSDLGSFIHGGRVLAFGSAMDWAESDSGQVTMNLQFASSQKPGAVIAITRADGSEVISLEAPAREGRGFSGLILSDPALMQGETYQVWVDGVQMAYTGTDVRRGPGGRRPGNMPEGFDPGQRPEGEPPAMPGGMTPPELPEGESFPDGERSSPPEGMEPPEHWKEGRPEIPADGFHGAEDGGQPSTEFYMNDMVNFFAGLTAA